MATLTYHLAYMLQRLGHQVLAVDLDPQANLTASFFDEDDLAVLWQPNKDFFERLLGRLQEVRATS